ncbi:MAG: hypothetical protein ACREBR_00200 [bacterium]
MIFLWRQTNKCLLRTPPFLARITGMLFVQVKRDKFCGKLTADISTPRGNMAYL